MIVFDLSALADDSHRRHFIDPDHYENEAFIKALGWEPDYASYYAACDQDKVVESITKILEKLSQSYHIEVWSDACESVRNKLEEWIKKHIQPFYKFDAIKMRPIGDDRPTHLLFGQWLDEYMSYPTLLLMEKSAEIRRNDLPEMAFSADPDVIAMFRRRGVFTFDCNQGTS